MPRPLTTDEIMVIQNGLLGMGYGYLMNKVEQMSTSLELSIAFIPQMQGVVGLNHLKVQ